MAWYSAMGSRPDLNSASTPKRIREHVEISSDDSSDELLIVKRQKTLPLDRTRTRQNAGASSSTPAVVSDSDSDSGLELVMPPRRKTPTTKEAVRVDAALIEVDYSQFKNKQPALAPPPSSDDWSKSQIQASKAESDRTRYIQMEERPFYDMDNLGVRMYRGPGFENFHIAVGTLDGIQELCDEWTRKTLALRHDLKPLPEMTEARKRTLAQDRFVGKATEILPDIDPDYLRATFDLYADSHPDKDFDTGDHALMMDVIMQSTKYPKVVKQKRKEITFEPAKDGTGVTIPVRADMRERPDYEKQGVIILAWEFLHVPTITIAKVMERSHTIYDTYIELERLDTRYWEIGAIGDVIRRKKKPRTSIEKKYQLDERPDQAALPFWLNEVQAAKQFVTRRDMKLDSAARWKQDEAENAAYHREQNSLTVCLICYDEAIPINRAVPCQGDKIHFFCYGCVQSLADAQIGMLKHEMRCCSADECAASLDRKLLEEALGKRIIAKLDSIQQATDIRNAEIEGLEQCPYCDYKQIFDADDVSPVFQCMDPDCSRLSCRKCREEAHVPETCAEVKGRGLDARHRVEEARSESIMRTCPKCKVRIIKDLGCNKMVCVQCRNIMCYICQEDITGIGYDHFNKAGSKCVLYDHNTNEMHEHEADAAERAAIAEVRARYGDIDEEELQIETGKAKNDPAPANAPQRAPQAYPVLRGFNPQVVPAQQREAQLRPLQPNDPRNMAQMYRMRQQDINRGLGAAGYPGANLDGHFDYQAVVRGHARAFPAANNNVLAAPQAAPDRNGVPLQVPRVPRRRVPVQGNGVQPAQAAANLGYLARIRQMLAARML